MLATPLFFLMGICNSLESEKDIEITARASTDQEITQLIERKKPGVLLLDTIIPHLNILKTLGSIEEKSPETKVLLLLHTLDEEVIINVLSLGVRDV